jgi:hypothetical protein
VYSVYGNSGHQLLPLEAQTTVAGGGGMRQLKTIVASADPVPRPLTEERKRARKEEEKGAADRKRSREQKLGMLTHKSRQFGGDESNGLAKNVLFIKSPGVYNV